MRRILFILSIFTFLFIFLPKPSQAFNCINDVRCAECDRCGYCNNQAVPKAPGNWEQCRACLYPDASPDFKENESLVIGQNPDTTLFEQVTPAVGKYYTQLGCIDTGVDSFSDPSAPGGVLNFMLTKVIFPTVGVLAFMALIYGAFLLITAESRPDQIARGKSYIVGAIVGLIFTLSIILIVNTLAGDILRIPGFSKGTVSKISAVGETATIGGKETFPILGVYIDNKEVSSRTLTAGDQNVDISLPIKLDLSKPGEVSRVSFTMKNDECFTVSATRNSTCCDPVITNSTDPATAEKRRKCADPTNYNGDINMRIGSISIEGNVCKSYTKDDQATNLPLVFSSSGSFVSCTGI